MEVSTQLTDKQRFWQQHVLQAQTHTGSLAEYAKQQQLKATSLYYWVSVFSRHKASAEVVGFSAVRVAPPASAVYYTIHLSSRLTLRCSVLPDPQWLATLCRELDRPA